MTDINKELLPCPFCGGTAKDAGTTDTDIVFCTKCDATIVTEIGGATTAWNTRPIPSVNQELLEALRLVLSTVENCHDCWRLDALEEDQIKISQLLEKANAQEGKYYE